MKTERFQWNFSGTYYNLKKMASVIQKNITESWSIKETGRIMFEYFPVNFLSICLNAFIIFLAFASKEINKSHPRLFIANTAFLNLLYSSSFLFSTILISAFHVLDIRLTARDCNLQDVALQTFGAGALLSYLPTICCRYLEVKLDRPCGKKLIVFLLLYPYTVAIGYILNSWILADSQREGLIPCKTSYSEKYEPIIALVMSFHVLSSQIIQLILFVRLYRHLKWHFKHISANVRTNLNAAERLKTEKSILMAILIQGAGPIVLALPIVARHLLQHFLDFDPQKPLIFGISARNLTAVIYTLNQVVDALAVLFVTIPYSRARKRFLRHFWKKMLRNFCCTEASETAAAGGSTMYGNLWF